MRPRFSFLTLFALAILLLPWLAAVAVGDWLGVQWDRAAHQRHH